MNEENVKLAKIKKSCHAGKIVTRILFIIAVVGTIMAIAGGSIILAMGKDFDNVINQATEEGYIDPDANYILSVRVFGFSISDKESFHSDIPAIQEMLNDRPYSLIFGIYVIAMGFMVAIVAVLMKLVESVFALIETEDTPFTDKVRRRVTIVLIVTSVFLLMTMNAAFGILGALVTWVVNAILDYGKTLQIQSDETL